MRTVRARRKRKIIFVCALVLIIAISIFAGVFSYGKIVDARLSSADTNASEALTSTQESVQYTLIKVDTEVSGSTSSSYDEPQNRHIYVLLRSDLNNKAITLIMLPSNLAVSTSNSQMRPLYKTLEVGGDAELIRSVGKFFSISINHLVSINSVGLESLVDALGTVKINLPCTIDDPYASNKVFAAGEVQLSGSDTLSILRARNISNSSLSRSTIATLIISALLDRALSSEGINFANILSQLSNNIYCDVTSSDISSTLEKLSPFNEIDIRSASLSGSISKSTDTGEEVFSPRTSETTALISNFTSSGQTTSKTDNNSTYLETSSIHVEVRNGAGIAGAATSAKNWLETQGYVVDKAGNADEGYIYSETLIVYLGDSNKYAAETITSGLGCGRVVNGGDYYTSASGVIVIIGSDWNPII